MKIGIDAKWYFGGPPSGVRVIRNLVNNILAIDRSNQYYIFLNKKYKDQQVLFPGSQNVWLVYVWAGNNLLSNLFVVPLKANRLKLDVMLFQNFVSPFFVGRKVAYIFDALFVSFPQYFSPLERLYFFFIKYLSWFSDQIVTLSYEEKRRMTRHGFSNLEKIQVIYIGVEKSFTPMQHKSGHRKEDVKRKYNLPNRYLLYVGRLNARKNIELLVRALSKIRDRSIPLVIVGKEDWKQSDFRLLAKDDQISNRLIFTGWTADEDLPAIYAGATVFCFPSYAEGFGLPPLEAMASGVPVVSSNATCLPEVCGNAALFFSPQQPQELAAVIDRLLDDQELYREMVSRGIRHASGFAWESTARNFIAVFEKNQIYF